MDIDTNANGELPNDHPTIRELSKEEEGIYMSAIEAMAEAATVFEEHCEQEDELDLEVPEVKKNSDKLQTAIAVGKVLEELAAWRKNGIMAEGGSTISSLDPEFEADSYPEDEKDE